MLDISLFGAAFAGLLSFLSPCILPMVPFYLGYMAGQSVHAMGAGAGDIPDQVRHRAVIGAMCFSAGIITVFVAMGMSATALGQFMRAWMDILRYGAALVIFMMGLHFLGVIRIGLLHRQLRMDIEGGVRWSLLGAYVIGLAFAFGWTPCVGPVLAAILFTAAGEESIGRGGLLLLAYALGMTLPFVLAAFFIAPFMRWMAGFRRQLGRIEKLMGAVLILFAVLIGTNGISRIAEAMLAIAPDIGILR
ncbi:MAG: cytochrome c biogenesis protein CcdA [Pseudomonadota bacterium]